jgi:GTPase SAR1 family protein
MMSNMSQDAAISNEGSTMKLPPVVDRIANQTPDHKAPICVLMVGMAGSGKTTLMSQLQQSTIPEEPIEAEQEQQEDGDDSKPAAAKPQEGDSSADDQANSTTAAAAAPPPLAQSKMPAYCINLDPATLHVPYNVSIDIRDTVDYKVSFDSTQCLN